jgi:hypothetical protein
MAEGNFNVIDEEAALQERSAAAQAVAGAMEYVEGHAGESFMFRSFTVTGGVLPPHPVVIALGDGSRKVLKQLEDAMPSRFRGREGRLVKTFNAFVECARERYYLQPGKSKPEGTVEIMAPVAIAVRRAPLAYKK